MGISHDFVRLVSRRKRRFSQIDFSVAASEVCGKPSKCWYSKQQRQPDTTAVQTANAAFKGYAFV